MFGILCDHGAPRRWWAGPTGSTPLSGMAVLLDIVGPTPLGLAIFFSVAGVNDRREARAVPPPKMPTFFTAATSTRRRAAAPPGEKPAAVRAQSRRHACHSKPILAGAPRQ